MTKVILLLGVFLVEFLTSRTGVTCSKVFCRQRDSWLDENEVCDCGPDKIDCYGECLTPEEFGSSVKDLMITADGSCMKNLKCDHQSFQCGDDCKLKSDYPVYKQCRGQCIKRNERCLTHLVDSHGCDKSSQFCEMTLNCLPSNQVCDCGPDAIKCGDKCVSIQRFKKEDFVLCKDGSCLPPGSQCRSDMKINCTHMDDDFTYYKCGEKCLIFDKRNFENHKVCNGKCTQRKQACLKPPLLLVRQTSTEDVKPNEEVVVHKTPTEDVKPKEEVVVHKTTTEDSETKEEVVVPESSTKDSEPKDDVKIDKAESEFKKFVVDHFYKIVIAGIGVFVLLLIIIIVLAICSRKTNNATKKEIMISNKGHTLTNI